MPPQSQGEQSVAFDNENILFIAESRRYLQLHRLGTLGTLGEPMRRTREKGGIPKIAMIYGVTCFMDLRSIWKADK